MNRVVIPSHIAQPWLARLFLWAFLAFFCAALFLLNGYLERKAAVPDPETKVEARYAGLFRSDPVYIVLKRAGVREPELSAVIQELKKDVKPRSILPDDTYMVALSTSGAFRGFQIHQGGRTIYYVARVNSGRLVRGKMNMEVRTEREVTAGVIKDSLWNSMVARRLSPALVMEFADAFAWNVDFLTETNDGDVYALVWEKKSTADRVIGREIKAVYYNGRASGKKAAFLSGGEYYDEKGECLKRMFLRAPLQYRRISSYFTNSRYHPILRIFRPHHAIDYAAPTGTPVSSIGEGTVKFAGWRGGLGNYVEIAHPQGYTSGYGHLHNIAKGVARGKRVQQGQLVGHVGTTGLSTGPHLDFRFLHNGTPLNFLKTKARSVSKSVPAKEKKAYLEQAAKLSAEMEKAIAGL
ncbi:MAG: M23 family metallopeptidase [Elusimicrobia bacterium]|nr:M23 family metallopeptidase [Elusimicrobiota bacterium]